MEIPDSPFSPGRASYQADVRALRARMALTQEQFALRLDVTPLTVLRWEAGHSRPRKLALARLRQLDAEAAARVCLHPATTPTAPVAPTLDLGGDPEAVSVVAEALRLAYGHQFNPAFASEISAIDPLPHQRIAVYERMLPREPLRFLLADDAGAGKTIMTGLVVREMLSRGRIRRVLVVPPAGLVGNWERELRALFSLSFRIVSGADARTGRSFGSPEGDLAIVSLDTLAGQDVFATLRDSDTPPYDLVIFDEAHKLHANADEGHGMRGPRTHKTRRYELAEALAGCAPPTSDYAGLGWSARHLLLLTATPHMGKDSPYHHLWRLLDSDVFATADACRRFIPETRDRHFIRRTKEEMVDLDARPLYPRRLCDTFSYDLSPDGEQALYDDTTTYLRRAYSRALGNRSAARLAMGVFQRRLASSTWALLRSFERRIEKLEALATALREGRIGAEELRRRQRRLDERHRADYFDTHTADEESAEAHADFEARVLGAVAIIAIEKLQEEIDTLRTLRDRARAILNTGRESKFEKLRAVLEDPRYATEKWLVFTEHRDTLDYLVNRLEGLGYTGQVAQIHGGMAWPEREAQMQRFRDTQGARYLVATDAAGEGINLQFCHLMASYDIPWNPARLEQRMGRIHRYGQRQEVRIVNLVAGSTREGRVLQVLLDKLEAIRKELHSDKVFDVIGRLFENTSLREYMIEALDDEQGVMDRVANALAGDRVQRIEQRQHEVYGARGDVAGRLDDLREGMARERYLQLLPGYVRRFVDRCAGLLGLVVRGDLGGFFSLAPARTGALDAILPALETYPPAARERLCVHRPPPGTNCVWLHPGEAVFDALAAEIMRRFSRDALRGGIFTDPKAGEPYFIHLLLAAVEQNADPGLGEPAAAAPPACRTMERRLLAVRHDGNGAPAACDIDGLLLLRPAPEVAPGAVPLAARGAELLGEAGDFTRERLAEELAARHRDALDAVAPEQRRRMRVAFDLRAAELAKRRAELADRRAEDTEDQEVARTFHMVKDEQRALSAARADALAQLDGAAARVRPGEVRFLAHALAVPATGAVESARYDARVEDIAIGIATSFERSRGASVRDVSKPALARAAGLSSWPGFDLLSTHTDTEERCIEVKGRAGRTGIQMEANEWKQACHRGERYWLYVVLDCATPSPSLYRIRDPFAKLLTTRRSGTVITIPTTELIEAAEPA